MSLKYQLCDPNPIYTVSYTVCIDESKNLMQRAARKAMELNVHGYMTHTQSGRHAVCGEVEGRRDDLELLLLWLQQEMPPSSGQAQFIRHPPRKQPKYDEFFCC